MLVLSCPSCQKQVRMPAEMAGKKVRCPLCSTIFQTPAPAGAAGPAAAPVPPPPPEPERAERRRDDYDEDDRPRRRRDEYAEDDAGDDRPRRRRRRGDDDEDDFADDRPRRRDDFGPDDEDDRPRARGAGRDLKRKAQASVTAAVVMLVLSGLVTTALALETVYAAVTVVARMQGTPEMVGTIFGAGIVTLMAVFMFVGAGSLRAIWGTGFVVTAIVMALLRALLGGIAVVMDLALMANPRVPEELKRLLLIEAGLGGLSLVVCGLAGILAIVALNSSAVRRAYRAGAARRREELDWED